MGVRMSEQWKQIGWSEPGEGGSVWIIKERELDDAHMIEFIDQTGKVETIQVEARTRTGAFSLAGRALMWRLDVPRATKLFVDLEHAWMCIESLHASVDRYRDTLSSVFAWLTAQAECDRARRAMEQTARKFHGEEFSVEANWNE